MRNLLIVIVIFHIVSCKSQDAKIESVPTDMTEMKKNVLQNLTTRNNALISADFHTLYHFLHPIDVEGLSEHEFVNGAQKTQKEMYHDVLFEKIEILNVDEIKWIFVHGDIEGLKKRYPDICL